MDSKLPHPPVDAKVDHDDEDHRNDPRYALRRERLKDLIDQHFYGRTSIFCKRVGKNPSLVSQYKSGEKKLGERFCDDVERELDIPGWFQGGASDLIPSAATAAGSSATHHNPHDLSLEAVLSAIGRMNPKEVERVRIELDYRDRIGALEAPQQNPPPYPKDRHSA